jgi:Putative transposase
VVNTKLCFYICAEKRPSDFPKDILQIGLSKLFHFFFADIETINVVQHIRVLPINLISAVYLSRYTHRVAISNRRLIAADDGGVSSRWKDYRIEGPGRWKTMTLTPHEFIRRFLMHVLPSGFHRIRHYGLLASGTCAVNIARARELIAVPVSPEPPDTTETPAADEPRMLPRPCPCCGGRMFIIETFARGCQPKHRPTPASGAIRIDTS